MYICIYVSMYICIYVYLYICIHAYTYICIDVHMYICILIYVHMFICKYVYIYIHTCIYMWTYVERERETNVYIYIYMVMYTQVLSPFLIQTLSVWTLIRYISSLVYQSNLMTYTRVSVPTNGLNDFKWSTFQVQVLFLQQDYETCFHDKQCQNVSKSFNINLRGPITPLELNPFCFGLIYTI